MSQMKWFKKLSTVILIILAHYYDYLLGRRACCAHFCITDDLEKSNEMITHCVDHVREFFDRTNAAAVPVQPPNAHLFLGSDNAANQAKNDYHFAWMVIMLRKTMGFRPSSKILQLNSTEKVLFSHLKSVSTDFWLPNTSHLFIIFGRSMGCRRRWWKNRCRKSSVTWVRD